MSEDVSRQTIVDEEHLKLLSIGYMVSAATNAFFALFGLLYVFMGMTFGSVLSKIPAKAGEQPPPALIGWLFIGLGLAFFVLALGFGIAKFFVARCIKRRKARTFCLVVAAIECLGVPYGTVLGVFTFLVLERDSIKHLFSVPLSASPSV